MKKCLDLSTDYCSRFYTLPKVHKINISLEPIVSNIGMTIYQTAKFLVVSFFTICDNNTHLVNNSYKFVNRIKNS